MNKKRYWLRGGLVTAIIVPTFYFLTYSNFLQNEDANILQFLGGIIDMGIENLVPSIFSYSIVTNIMRIVGFGNPEIFGPFNLSDVFSFAIVYFIIGAIIGWIYGKIRSRKQTVEKYQ